MPGGCHSSASSLSMTARCRWPGAVSRLPGHWPPPSWPLSRCPGLGGETARRPPNSWDLPQMSSKADTPTLVYLYIGPSVCPPIHSVSSYMAVPGVGWWPRQAQSWLTLPLCTGAPLKPVHGRAPKGWAWPRLHIAQKAKPGEGLCSQVHSQKGFTNNGSRD